MLYVPQSLGFMQVASYRRDMHYNTRVYCCLCLVLSSGMSALTTTCDSSVFCCALVPAQLRFCTGTPVITVIINNCGRDS